MRILLAEDDIRLNALISKSLKAEHYVIDCCFDGEDALNYISVTEYDIIVLDIMMPKKTGLEVLSEIRKAGNICPVLLLTAKDSIEDRVRGLDCGADDYLVKPFAFVELLARIRAMIRRKGELKADILKLADLTMDCRTHIVKRGDVIVELSSKEYSILEYMLRNPGTVMSRQRIEEHIWNYSYEGQSNMIDVYIRYLRKKIDEKSEKKLIKTVRGIGYVLSEK